jgi:hypothetical protein
MFGQCPTNTWVTSRPRGPSIERVVALILLGVGSFSATAQTVTTIRLVSCGMGTASLIVLV